MPTRELPLFAADRVFTATLAAAFGGFVWSEHRIGRQKPISGAVSRDDGSGRAVGLGLVLTYGGGLLVSVCSPKTVHTRYPRTLFCAGLAIAAAGQAFRLRSVIELGPSFTFQVHTHPEQDVVTTGPYRYIRHPSYAGALICALGFCIADGNWLSPTMVAFLAGGYVRRIPAEEAAMLTGLGTPYADYMRRTKRLIPFIF